MRLSVEGTAHGFRMPTKGDIEVPAPFPYSLDDADGMFAASADTAEVDVEEVLFVVEETELTFIGASTGKFVELPPIEPAAPPPVEDVDPPPPVVDVPVLA